MRYQGKITSWKDDQGFGFITPNGGGDQVFVHIKSFTHRQKRPAGNEIVTYELSMDGRGRARAENVAFFVRRDAARTPSEPGNGRLMLAGAFLAFVMGAAVAGRLPFAVPGLYLIASVVAFVAYAIDKSAARHGRWRTAEKTLHLLAIIGGWPGALAAQQALPHKSKKQPFQLVFRATVIVNCAALGWLFSPYGAALLRSVATTA